MSLEPGSTFGGATGDMSTYADMIVEYIIQEPCKTSLDLLINSTIHSTGLTTLLVTLNTMVPPVP